MIKTITSITRWLANRLTCIALWLESLCGSTHIQSKFVDLAPTDEADKSGVYSEAILWATNNEKISNIALTGPYGSGKSSIIQSFLRKYRRPTLHISLAAFLPETGSKSDNASRQEIERSILQQMLYGADANKLPLSRFKRIQSPGIWSIFKSFYIMLGILSSWYVFHQRESIIDGAFFIPPNLSNWLNLGTFCFALIFLWATLHHFYVASFGLSLKSISLKDVEIKPALDDQASILNRHLDEIVYFFQSTKYDLVIIEDLDRFNNSEIFVTLREINSLVNENAGVKRTIRFLYALRDDMFTNTDRTKFFEFIIPVIPIINTSNSIDMVLEQGRRLELDERLDRQFLREVSRYLNDLRLIQNIFNEYTIYVANLETDNENLLDTNKLLAILIYKNVYPNDFEQLHQGKGNLSEILNFQDDLIKYGEAEYREEITKIEQQLEAAEQQTPSDLQELRKIYAMTLIEKISTNITSISKNRSDKRVATTQIANSDEFDNIINSKVLYCHHQNGGQSHIDISQLQIEVNSQQSYQRRKESLELKANEKKTAALKKISNLKSRIQSLRSTKLNELLRLNASRAKSLFENFGENGELARFLILEGYLDDTYYQYTSLFHSGRLSRNDNKFLIQIRAFITPEPEFSIDNPTELIAAMRKEDFRQSYVLNVKLVDSILCDQNRYSDQSQKFFEYLSSEFESSQEFFEAYYSNGNYTSELLTGLVNTWEDFIPSAINSSINVSHLTQLITYIPIDRLRDLSLDFDPLSDFVAEHLVEIIENSPELDPERLSCLRFEVKSLPAIKKHYKIMHFMFEQGSFELTIPNLEFAYLSILGERNLKSLREKNYTTIHLTKNKTLINRVEKDFNHYLSNILLELPTNTQEDVPSITKILNQNTLNTNDIAEFLERQTTRLPTLENIPEDLDVLVFKLNMIEPTWENCLTFMRSDCYEAQHMIDFLNQESNRAKILKHPIPDNEESLSLRQFLFSANSLTDNAYREYIQALPQSFKKPPTKLEPEKLKILIDEKKIVFSKEGFDALSNHENLQVLFVVTNIEKYLENPSAFELNDEFLEKLLLSETNLESQARILRLMDLASIISLPERASLIGPIIDRANIKFSKLDGITALSLVKNTRPLETQVSLFNKLHPFMTNDEVRQTLASLPKPFSDIKIGYLSPRLKNNIENLDLVRWLDSRNIISSWSEGSKYFDEIKVNLYRR